MAFRDFLLERLLAYDPTIDPDDPDLATQVLDPADELLGEDLPQSDPRAIVQARLDEADPNLDGTVFADIFGKVAAAMWQPLNFEVRAALNRRRLDDSRLLTGSDLQDLKDFFLVDAQEGGYAQGIMRVYYSTPRSLQFDVTLLATVSGTNGGAARVFRPSGPQNFPVSVVRSNIQGGLYFVDVAMVATSPGEYYNLLEGEASGASGFPGSVRVTNPRRFSGGVENDSIDTFLARIRNSVTLRSLSTVGGINFVLPQLAIGDFKVVQGGSPLMVRDRIYGPTTISGIPGGFRLPREDVAIGDFVSLGIAFDIWVSPEETQQLVSAKLSNVKNEGVEILSGGDGTLVYLGFNNYTLTTLSTPFTEVVSTPELLTPLGKSLRPVQVGDVVTFSHLFTSILGERLRLVVTAVSDSVLALNNPTSSFNPAVGTVTGSHYAVFRPLNAYNPELGEAFAHPMFLIPLTDVRSLGPQGDEQFVGSLPALPEPGTTNADIVDGTRVPRLFNVTDDVSSFPFSTIERLEILDPVTETSREDYVYPRMPLYLEFLQSLSGSVTERATVLRVHVLGPQATALGDCLISSSSNLTSGATQMIPLWWTYTEASTVGIGAETDTIEISGASVHQESGDIGNFTSNSLAYSLGLVTVSDRLPRVGDWALFRATAGPPDNGFFLPIVEIVDATTIRVSAPDIPTGLTGTVEIFQGTSRANLIAEGRGPEGTYSFDVYLREKAAGGGYVPGDPPLMNTKAYMDFSKILSQGFELLSPLPGFQFSTDEKLTLGIQGTHVVDNQEIIGRAFLMHAAPGGRIQTIQEQLDSDANRPIVTTGLAKGFSPSFVVVGFYYDAVSLEVEAAAQAVLDAFINADFEDRLELSDLINALYSAGADYVEAGRVFVLRQDHNRNWDYFSSKGAIPSTDIGDFILQAVTVTRLNRRAKGQVLDTQNPDNYLEGPYTLRPGGFDSD